MRKLLTEFFYYTKTERNGALILSLICVLLFVAPHFFPLLQDESASPNFEVVFASMPDAVDVPVAAAEEMELFPFDPNAASKEEFIQLGLSPKLAQTIINYRSKGGRFYEKEDLQKIYTLRNEDYERLEPYISIGKEQTFNNHKHKQHYTKTYVEGERAAELFSFDPNIASREELIQLGLPGWISDNIIKYREHGGAFRKKEDLQRIYGLKNEDYLRLAPYITLPESTAKEEIAVVTLVAEESPDFPARAEQPVIIDINRASAEEWQALRGVGPAYAKRITGFREKLGGFSSIQQIAETYGLPDSTFQLIKTQLRISPVTRKIAINTASVETLRQHPYMDARKAAAIVSFREQHGAFQSIADLQKVKALSADLLKKLEPYLEF